MTILVTGGAGYIGSHMVHELVDAGERVVVLDNLSTGFRLGAAQGGAARGRRDRRQALVAALIAEHGVDAIIHFAASIVVPDSVADPLGYYRNNTVNSRALIETAVKAGVRHFIFSSTAAVYGNPRAIPVDEDDRHDADVALRLLQADDGDHAARRGCRARARLSSFCATSTSPAPIRACAPGSPPRGRPTSSRSRSRPRSGCARRSRSSAPITTTPDGTCIRDYIHVTDLVRAHADALRHLRGGGASVTLNCGYGRGFSVLEVIDTVKRASGVDFKVVTSGRRPGDPAAIVADSKRIRALLGWTPQLDDLETIVAHALKWERRRQSMQAAHRPAHSGWSDRQAAPPKLSLGLN